MACWTGDSPSFGFSELPNLAYRSALAPKGAPPFPNSSSQIESLSRSIYFQFHHLNRHPFEGTRHLLGASWRHVYSQCITPADWGYADSPAPRSASILFGKNLFCPPHLRQ